MKFIKKNYNLFFVNHFRLAKTQNFIKKNTINIVLHETVN